MNSETQLEEDRSLKFSPSKLDVYKNCPKRYQYRYVDRIARARKSPETVLGVAAHTAFEELYGRVSGGQTPTPEQARGWFDAAFDEGWDADVVVRDQRFSKEDWRTVGHQCVESYFAQHSPFQVDKTMAVEKRVWFPITVEGHEYRIEGFVDRLSIAPDGAIEIHDYKTAKSLPSQASADADWQLALYELAVRREWPDAGEVRLKWHYVRHGRSLVSIRDAAARAQLLADAGALIGTIKRDHVFSPRKSALCDWCEYKDLCPEFAHPEALAAMSPAERRLDDGAELADRFAELEARRRGLKDELKELDTERDELTRRLADWAQAKGVSVVGGQRGEVALSFKEEVHLPTRTGEPERHAELERELRLSPLWGEVARFDAHALTEGVRTRRWAGELQALAESLLARFGRRAQSRTARLRKRAGNTEEEA